MLAWSALFSVLYASSPAHSSSHAKHTRACNRFGSLKTTVATAVDPTGGASEFYKRYLQALRTECVQLKFSLLEAYYEAACNCMGAGFMKKQHLQCSPLPSAPFALCKPFLLLHQCSADCESKWQAPNQSAQYWRPAPASLRLHSAERHLLDAGRAGSYLSSIMNFSSLGFTPLSGICRIGAHHDTRAIDLSACMCCLCFQ